jgi:hypothetical protein
MGNTRYVTLVDGIVFFCRGESDSFVGAFNLATKSKIVRLHALPDDSEFFAFNSRKKELVC